MLNSFLTLSTKHIHPLEWANTEFINSVYYCEANDNFIVPVSQEVIDECLEQDLHCLAKLIKTVSDDDLAVLILFSEDCEPNPNFPIYDKGVNNG
jgi:hypothetical protein